ncbi:MAG: hypothetical protein NC403_08445 [Muribaculaceae bacterium]|nr:hypothetical protein [Muribaculaceae bacterium]
MRTVNDIADNRYDIRNAMRTIQQQIDLLENEYQHNAVESMDMRVAEWDEMKAQLEAARKALNTLWHMEGDTEDVMRDAVEITY